MCGKMWRRERNAGILPAGWDWNTGFRVCENIRIEAEKRPAKASETAG